MTTRILVGDCRERLAEIPDKSVHCCVTSPPYFGLRDYSTGQWAGGDPGCEHGVARWDGPKQTQGAQSGHASEADRLSRKSCQCGAIRIDRQIGLEASLADYIAALVEVFREVRRVLRDDGTLWLNLGDSYAGSSGGDTKSGFNERYFGKTYATDKQGETATQKPRRMAAGLKPKDLMMVPARVAIALCDDGWYLRSDIIWSKKAPMPESVTDRPTSAHEHVFLLSKRPTYFYDAEAIREPDAGTDHPRAILRKPEPSGGLLTPHTGIRTGEGRNGTGRNCRNVWTLGPDSFPGAHFAVYPREIPRRAIKAGTSDKGCCAVCGAPWTRVVERESNWQERRAAGAGVGLSPSRPNRTGESPSAVHGEGVSQTFVSKTHTTGWQPSCRCDADVVSATVLDPFAGASTTGLVADQLGRDAVLIELSPEYAELARSRIYGDAPMFASVDVA